MRLSPLSTCLLPTEWAGLRHNHKICQVPCPPDHPVTSVMGACRAVLPPPIPSQLWSSKYRDVATSYHVRQVPASLETETRRGHAGPDIACRQWRGFQNMKRNASYRRRKAGCRLTRHIRVSTNPMHTVQMVQMLRHANVPSYYCVIGALIRVVELRSASVSGTSQPCSLNRIAVCVYLSCQCIVTPLHLPPTMVTLLILTLPLYTFTLISTT
jgi:hypothetical protein